MKDNKIGFVGLGRMGGNMARCLQKKGYKLTAVFDIDADVAQELAAEIGAKSIESFLIHHLQRPADPHSALFS